MFVEKIWRGPRWGRLSRVNSSIVVVAQWSRSQYKTDDSTVICHLHAITCESSRALTVRVLVQWFNFWRPTFTDTRPFRIHFILLK